MNIDRFKPRFGDLDGLGHVNHAKFATYFEIGRVNIFQEFRQEQGESVKFILARLEIDYLEPILLDAKLEIQTWVSRIGNKSFNLEYLLRDYEKNVVHAKGISIQVRFDYDLNQSIPLSAKEKSLLVRYKKN